MKKLAKRPNFTRYLPEKYFPDFGGCHLRLCILCAVILGLYFIWDSDSPHPSHPILGTPLLEGVCFIVCMRFFCFVWCCYRILRWSWLCKELLPIGGAWKLCLGGLSERVWGDGSPPAGSRGGAPVGGLVPFERALVSSYRPSIVTLPLSLRVSEILALLFSRTPLKLKHIFVFCSKFWWHFICLSHSNEILQYTLATKKQLMLANDS